MESCYYIRLDDACPEMDLNRWNKIFNILRRHKLYPLIGIIPNNKDSNTIKSVSNPLFWDEMSALEQEGAVIALHGYDHCYISKSGGINPVHKRSEFAGVDIDIQNYKIRNGYRILYSHHLTPKVFFAPSHTFDKNTISAILTETTIRNISDTMARAPYVENGITFLPQQFGSLKNIKIPGHWTFCLHPNEMTDDEINHFDMFIGDNRSRFHNYGELISIHPCNSKPLIDKLLNQIYFIYRKIKS